MDTRDTWEQYAVRFPTILQDRRTRELLRANAVVREVGDGDVLYHDGDECSHLPLVISGEIVLTKYGDTGRAITLYRVADGESCILSTLSIINESRFPAQAASSGKTVLVLVPASVVRRLVDENPAWRAFVFSMYHQRLSGLIELVEEVTFGKLDTRLAEYLLRRSDGKTGSLNMTHQELAIELGSSREVVSRLLKEWERHGKLELRRGSVRIVDRARLAQLTNERD